MDRSIASPASRSIRRPGGLAGGVAAGVATLGIAVDGLNGVAGQAVLCLLWSGLTIGLLIVAPPRVPFWRRIAPIVGVLAAGFAWSCLPLLVPGLAPPLAPDLIPAEAAALAGYIAALAAGALLAREPRAASASIDALIALGCATIALGVILRNTALAEAVPLWQFRAGNRFDGTLGNPNAMGAYCGALAALACDRAIGATARGRAAALARTARFVAVVVALAACGATGSRSAILLTGLVLVLLIGNRLRTGRLRQGSSRALLAGAAALGIAAIVGLSVAFADRYAISGLGSTGRAAMWAHYAGVSAGSPWFGYGPGSFPSLNQRTLGTPEAAHLMWTVNSPHDVLLQLMLDGGVGLTIAATVAAVLLIRGIVAAVRADRLGPGVPAALAVLVGSGLVDITLDIPALLALTLFLAGLGLATRYRERVMSSSIDRARR